MLVAPCFPVAKAQDERTARAKDKEWVEWLKQFEDSDRLGEGVGDISRFGLFYTVGKPYGSLSILGETVSSSFSDRSGAPPILSQPLRIANTTAWVRSLAFSLRMIEVM